MTSDATYELPDINLSPLERALGQYQIAIDALAATPEDALIRDAVIQRFEFTYELSIKMLRRYLRFVSISDDEVNEFTFRDLIRRASDLKLIQGDVAAWIAFRQPFIPIMKVEPWRLLPLRRNSQQKRALLSALKERVQP